MLCSGVSFFAVRRKSDIFCKQVARAEKLLNAKLKYIQSDNGTEFTNENLRNYCEVREIKHKFTNE